MRRSSGTNSAETGQQPNPISGLLQRQVVPWIREFGMQRVVIAHPSMKDVVLPPGVQITRKKRRGRRVSARGATPGEVPGMVSAVWPDDQQIEVRTPQMLCVVEGQADIHLSDYVLHCPPGYFVFIPPGTAKPAGLWEPHLEGKNREHGHCDILWFALHRRWMQMWMCHSRENEHSGPQFHENVITTDSQPAFLLEALWEGLSSFHMRYEELYNSLLNALMLSLVRDIQEERFIYILAEVPDEKTSESSSEANSAYNPIELAQEYVVNHLQENLTLAKVAQKVHMSRAQFAKRFREESGETFNEFTTRCRLDHAQQLLRETDFTVGYISQFVGYRSSTHLHNLFEKHLQTTPLQFRQGERQRSRQSLSVDDN